MAVAAQVIMNETPTYAERLELYLLNKTTIEEGLAFDEILERMSHEEQREFQLNGVLPKWAEILARV